MSYACRYIQLIAKMPNGRTPRVDFTDQASTSITEITSGSYRLKFGFSQIKDIGIGNFFLSPNFTIGGLEWYIKCYPEGYYAKDKGKYMSLYLSYASETEVSVIFEFCLLDRKGNPTTSLRSRNTHTFRRPGKYKGWSKFIKRDDLEMYVRDDHFEAICSVAIVSPKSLAEPQNCLIVVPPSDLPEQLGQLLRSQEGTDITFVVGGEIFYVHKLLLALRSPVFKAELFGPMKENHAKRITIEDMEPVVFKALLHFIYTDSLPEEKELKNSVDGPDALTIMMQHLLVAADRYALERLKLICQEELSKNVSAATVATTLALAEQHNCPQLKDMCLEFATARENYHQMVSTEGYKHLSLSCPSIFKEIEEKHGATTLIDDFAEQADEDNNRDQRFSLLKLFLCNGSTK
ncbi:BTB/POZ/MATH-domain protein [Rhynchospora pubera]|uniref:BTB/POZ/MATH-domain protein n=1 Tax=Rhynchospora pubera TaxID=906938 RepID=A0AAV8GF32_9POAL|nr:BTB/POZ/MATH-domain protein [Rhynchospora pubera]